MPKNDMTMSAMKAGSKKSWSRSDKWSSDNSWTGTAMIYTANGKESFRLSGDFEIDYQNESYPEEHRAAKIKAETKKLKERAQNIRKLGNELVVIFGPDMSALQAVHTLKSLISRIEDEGLCIGRATSESDDWIRELPTIPPRFL